MSNACVWTKFDGVYVYGWNNILPPPLDPSTVALLKAGENVFLHLIITNCGK